MFSVKDPLLKYGHCTTLLFGIGYSCDLLPHLLASSLLLFLQSRALCIDRQLGSIRLHQSWLIILLVHLRKNEYRKYENTITMLLDIDTYQEGFITASNTGSKDEKIICKNL